MAQKGVADTKLIDIAKMARVDHPLVKYYFPQINELHLEIFQIIVNDLKDHVLDKIPSASKSPKELLKNYINSYFDWGNKNPIFVSLYLFFYYQASFKKEFVDLNSSVRQTGRNRIEAMLYEGCAKKAFKIKPDDVPNVAVSIQGLLTGNMVMAYTEKNKWPVSPQTLTNKTIDKLLA